MVEAVPYVVGFCDRISATESAEWMAGSRWQRLGRLGRGEVVRWKLSLTILDSVTDAVSLTRQSVSGRESFTWAWLKQYAGSFPLKSLGFGTDVL